MSAAPGALPFRSWPVPPDLPRRGRLLLVHGFAEHSGRHARLAERLAAAGFEVGAGDLGGHGLAAGRRGHVERWSDYLEDVDSWWRAMAGGEPPEEREPVFLFGHSMGGLVALDWALEHPDRVRALVLSSPAFETGFEPPGWRRVLARVVSRILPALSQPAGIPPEGISSVAQEVERYRSDPLVHDRATARFYVCFREAARRLLASAGRVSLPTLVLFGEADPIASLPAARRFAAARPERIRLVTFAGARHEVFHESPAVFERAVAEVLRFLEGNARG